MKKKDALFFLIFFVAIIAFWAAFLNDVNTYNSSEHTLVCNENTFQNGEYTDGNISARIGPRGTMEDGSLSSWICGGSFVKEDGSSVKRTYQACIYEFTITNCTDKTISDWGFKLGVSEDVNLSAGWNGDFTIHQNIKKDEKTQTVKSVNIRPGGIVLENHTVEDIFLIPLYPGDYFTYQPVEYAQELPIVPADHEHNTYFSKTIGFVLHIQDKPVEYITKFNDVEVYYTLYKNLYQEKMFYALIFVSGVWLAALVSFIIIRDKEKKFMIEREHDMKIIEQSMRVFVEFLDAKDPRTKGHSIRVAQYSRLLAAKIGYSEEECRNIYFTALMHDCGKVAIPDEILCKPGELTEEEYTLMKSHVQKGYNMLDKFDAIPFIDQGALYHHERYDGTGYPTGLKGEDIPRIGRLIAVADAFDTMTSIRCYRKALDRDKVLEELETNRGKQFDPEIVDALLELIASGEIKLRDNENVE